MRRWMVSSVLAMAIIGACGNGGGTARAQFEGGGEGAPKDDGSDIKIIDPVVDAAAHTVTMPTAFWNQHMVSWLEVAICGRPSDFLHETVLAITTTKAKLMEAMRKSGFHDADAWADTVSDFPRVRGDHALILVEVTREGKKETYSLDELITYQGWGTSAGPFGWMFKGDPERALNGEPTTISNATDRTRILQDDPQVALVFQGIQHSSQSFMDNPLAYNEWLFPVMRYQRNYTLLPAAVYDSNGKVPVTMTIQLVNEETLLRKSAAVWHDKPFVEYMLKQIDVAKQIDADKTELLGLMPALRKAKLAAQDSAVMVTPEGDPRARGALLMARIEKNYTALDAAWTAWGAAHPAFQANIAPDDLKTLQQTAARWNQHMIQQAKRADALFRATQAANDQVTEQHVAADPARTTKLQTFRGQEIEARAQAMIAENEEPLAYWREQAAHLNPKNDPRTDWIADVKAQVGMAEARDKAGQAGVAYGHALQQSTDSGLSSLQQAYTDSLQKMTIAALRLQLVNTEFEIAKRDGIPNDPDMPKLKAARDQIKGQLQTMGEPATAP